jgi:hypothetical protein
MTILEEPSEFHTAEVSIFIETVGSYFHLYLGFPGYRQCC